VPESLGFSFETGKYFTLPFTKVKRSACRLFPIEQMSNLIDPIVSKHSFYGGY